MATDLSIDISIFDAVPTQLLEEDRRSILTVQQLVARRFGSYSYLEIGSYLGGSLQPHLADERCVAVYSIDPRPPRQPDERGELFDYPDNTTQRMLDALAGPYGAKLEKLRCFDMDARHVSADDVEVPPRLCLIDGEHTDRAVLSDFVACLSLATQPAVIMFDDAHVVYRGLRRCLEEADGRGVAVRAYVLPEKIAVLELGDAGLYREPELAERIATAEAYLYLGEFLDHYRQRVMTMKAIPGVRLARRIRNAVLGRGGAIGGTRARQR